MRPRIGITTTAGLRLNFTLGIDRPNASLDTAYVDSVVCAGGLPLLLPSVDPELAGELVSGLDGLILSGGADVDPANYGAERHPCTEPADVERDAFELAAARAAREQGVPLLGICRGSQVLNVAHGGTLIQHVPDLTRDEHRDIARWNVAGNPVRVVEGTLLHELFGHTQFTVNSLHHQAVDRVADGFQVAAVDTAGIIEAIEATDGSPVLGVQWHPELLPSEGLHQALFVWLVNRAGDRRSVLS